MGKTRMFCRSCLNMVEVPEGKQAAVCGCCRTLIPVAAFLDRETVHRCPVVGASRRACGQEADQGPTIKETCPKCGHNEMRFRTLQLRSADEGQTVFFVCCRCRHSYSLNT